MFPMTFAYMGTQEWLIIGAVVLVLFGGAKIPQLARGLGEGIREFKKSVSPDNGDGGNGGGAGGDDPKPSATSKVAEDRAA